jgi:Ca2+-binding EF-hand superfamily protein
LTESSRSKCARFHFLTHTSSFDKQLREKIEQKNSQNINEVTFLNKQFKYFDISNKGIIDFEQFQRAVEKIGVVMTRFNLEQVFKRYDASGDGTLDFKEFSNMFMQKSLGSAPVEE